MAKPPTWQAGMMHCHRSICPKRGPDLLHATMLALGPLDEIGCEKDMLIDAVSGAEAEPVVLHLDHVEAQKGSEHAALVSSKSAAPARRLRLTLWNALRRAGVALPPPGTMRPHVTLNYRWQGDAFREPIEPIVWLIDELLLIESVTGETRHVVHGRFPIRPRQGLLFPLTRCLAA